MYLCNYVLITIVNCKKVQINEFLILILIVLTKTIPSAVKLSNFDFPIKSMLALTIIESYII